MYPFRVFCAKVGEHSFWVAQSDVLKGCVAQGDTQEEALSLFAEIEQEWIEGAKNDGWELPAVPSESMTDASGKLTLRISPFEHSKAAQKAKRLGISLNQYINDAIVSYAGSCDREKLVSVLSAENDNLREENARLRKADAHTGYAFGSGSPDRAEAL